MSINNPTFNRVVDRAYGESKISKGFYSRTIFSYTNQYSSPLELGAVDENEWTDSIDGRGLKFLSNNRPDYCHGYFEIPPYYWLPGKTIRFKGTFLVETADPETTFNMRFGLRENQNGTTEWLAIQNNDNNHIFALGNITEEFIPVSFHCLLMCGYLNYDDKIWFTANGFYRYHRFGDGQDKGTVVIQVPMWTYGVNYNGITRGLSLDFYNYDTEFAMNCFGTTAKYVQLQNLTIEELL